MAEFLVLVLVAFFATNSIDKTESVQLIDEIFGEGWWDNDKAEEWHKLTLEQTFHHQIDRQNTQIGQIEPNSTDQNPPITESDHSGQIKPNSTDQNPSLTASDHFGQIEPNSTDQNPSLTASDHFGQIEPNSTDQNSPLTESDHSGQIEPNSTDQNPPLTESDHSGQIEPNSTDQNPPLTESDYSGQIEPNSTDQNPPLKKSDHSDSAKNGEEQNERIKEITSNENIAENEQKRKIVHKFQAIKDEFKQKEKYSANEWTQIEEKIGNHLKVNRKKIYKWKKELGLSRRNPKNEQKNLVEKFDQMKAELKRAGLKNSYKNQINETVAKELGLSFKTIYRWKRELGQTKPKHKHSHSEKKELMNRYYEIKDKNSEIRDVDIAKTLKIGTGTLYRWKRQFHPNSVNGHSVEENAAANVQEIDKSNSGSI